MKELRTIFREILTMILCMLLLGALLAPHYHQYQEIITQFNR